MRRTAGAAAFAAAVLACAIASAQGRDVSTEVDVTVGQSSEDVRAASTQARVFGSIPGDWRFYAEATWANTWQDAGEEEASDAFGSAYPYNNRVRPMELYLEKTVTPRAGRPLLWGTRVGRYRTPFGLYSRSDQGYTGFLRAPLVRYGGYWALSNDLLETGASVVAGTPRLFAEVSLGVPQDEDRYHRVNGIDRVGRVQAAAGDVVVGVSYIHTQPFKEQALFAHGDTEFTGVDARWMRGGVQLRGEFLNGHPFRGTRTFGGYADVLVHRRFMGPVTAIARAERLDYVAGQFSSYPRRYTTGAKVRLSSMVVASVNVMHEPAYGTEGPDTALDVAFTFSARR